MMTKASVGIKDRNHLRDSSLKVFTYLLLTLILMEALMTFYNPNNQFFTDVMNST